MKSLAYRIVTTVAIGFFTLGTGSTPAAQAPLDQKSLKEKATHVVSGKILDVTSQIQKSTIETGAGINRDKVFTITLQIETVSKGSTLQVGDKIQVKAWQPHRRIPPIVGLQGHTTLPEKGDSATFYLNDGEAKTYKPLHPNGIKIDTQKPKQQTTNPKHDGR